MRKGEVVLMKCESKVWMNEGMTLVVMDACIVSKVETSK